MSKEKIDQLTERLDKATSGLKRGDDAKAATAEPPATSEPPVNKDAGADPFAKQAAMYDNNAVAKSFLALAREDKQFHYLADDKVLENPRAFLRKRHPMDAEPHLRNQFVVSDHEVEAIIGTLLLKGRGKEGVPLYDWLNQSEGGYAKTAQALAEAAIKGGFGDNSEIIRRELDVTAGTALIRTDIEPVLYEVYLRRFPAAEAIRRIPANGILHTYNRRTAPGTATTIDDLGDMSAAMTNSTIGLAQNSHIATIVSPRAIGLKLRYAVRQSGMNFGIDGNDNLELVAAMYAIASKNQALVLQGNYSTAVKTLDDEEGVSDNKGFDGLRTLLKGAGTSINKASSDAWIDCINRAVGQIMNAGGDVNNILVLMSVAVRFALNVEMQQFYRVNKGAAAGPFDTALSANGLVTIGEWLSRVLNIPANTQATGLGYYTYNGNPTEDIDVIDPSILALAYLGSPNPVILELPIGYNNKLSQVYYPFLMNGLVCYISEFLRKIRADKQTL